MKIFENSLEAFFLSRPNRFVVYARADGKTLEVHCPNPGRLLEILVPGRRLILEKARDPGRRTQYTLVGVYYKEKIIPLYAARANAVARELVLPQIYPEASSILPEQRGGTSRFDFLLRLPSRELFLEVKACTLVEWGVGMFPDAPTLRGRRHLEELAEQRGAVLFVLGHPDAELFMPNLHTDPLFSLTLWRLRSKLRIHCVSIRTGKEGDVSLVNRDIPVDWEPVRYCLEDRGSYLLLLHLSAGKSISVGSLRETDFPAGYYVYTGSGQKNLSKRLRRHHRKRKTLRWHIDYLSVHAGKIISFPIYSPHNLECRLAAHLMGLADKAYPHFGCSDCHCSSHLFYFQESPLANEAFRELLFLYRHKLAWSAD